MDGGARRSELPVGQQPAQRLLLYGSDVPHSDVILSAAQPWVSTFKVGARQSLGETTKKLSWYSDRAEKVAGDDVFASAALVFVQGVEGTICVTKSGGMIDESTIEHPEVASFFEALAGLLVRPPRIDVLGSNLSSSSKGKALVKQLAATYGLNVVAVPSLAEIERSDVEMARSAKLPGRTADSTYFRTSLLAQWKGSLEKPSLWDRLAWPLYELSPHPGSRWLRRAHWLQRVMVLLAASVGILVVLARIGVRPDAFSGDASASIQAVGAVALSLLVYIYLRYICWIIWMAGVLVLAFFMWLCGPLRAAFR